jgi:hypothetical protein
MTTAGMIRIVLSPECVEKVGFILNTNSASEFRREPLSAQSFQFAVLISASFAFRDSVLIANSRFRAALLLGCCS